MKPSKVVEALEIAIKADRPAFLWGPPGVGKSDVVAQVADKMGYTLVDVRAALLDPVDLRGLPVIEDGKVRWCPPDFLPKGKKKLLFLDELNAAPPLVQAACYQLVLDRKLGEYSLPKDCVIIAAGNRETDRAVTSRMSSALANRFAPHINFEVDVEDWVAWALNHDILVELIAFIRFRGELLHNFDPSRNEKAFPTPRSWEFASDIIKASGSSDLDFELLSGVVGEGGAVEFIGFLNIFKSLPDIDMVLLAPDKADVPTDPATLYAVCGALTGKATEQNFGRVVKYANRLPEEFSVLLVNDCVRKDEDLTRTKAFIEWVSKHEDVLM